MMRLEVHLRRQAARFFHAGNSTFQGKNKADFAERRRAEKDPIERTAGVKAVQRLFGELGAL
jgi:hypothetical protein